MKPLQFKKLAPVVVNPNDWREQEDGSLRCGNVVLRCDNREPYGDYIFERWHIYRVEKNGKLVRVHPKSRPWGYGGSGRAKIGASKLMQPVDAKSIPLTKGSHGKADNRRPGVRRSARRKR